MKSKFKLFDGQKPITISYKAPSGKLSILFARELNKLKIADNKSTQALYGIILSKYFSDDTSISTESNFIQAMQKAFSAGDITAEDMKKFVDTSNISTPEDIENDFKIYINLFKEIVDFSNLNPENRDLVSSDWDSDFWMDQNLQEVKEQVIFFRTTYL